MRVFTDLPSPFFLHFVHDRFLEHKGISLLRHYLVKVAHLYPLFGNVSHSTLPGIRLQLLCHQFGIVVFQVQAHPVAHLNQFRSRNLHAEASFLCVGHHITQLGDFRIVLDGQHVRRRIHHIRIGRQIRSSHNQPCLSPAVSPDDQITSMDKDRRTGIVSL